jgi:hypothetical protein
MFELNIIIKNLTVYVFFDPSDYNKNSEMELGTKYKYT